MDNGDARSHLVAMGKEDGDSRLDAKEKKTPLEVVWLQWEKKTAAVVWKRRKKTSTSGGLRWSEEVTEKMRGDGKRRWGGSIFCDHICKHTLRTRCF